MPTIFFINCQVYTFSHMSLAAVAVIISQSATQVFVTQVYITQVVSTNKIGLITEYSDPHFIILFSKPDNYKDAKSTNNLSDNYKSNNSSNSYCHGLRGSGLARLRPRRHMTQIFRFRLVLLGTPPPSSDP